MKAVALVGLAFALVSPGMAQAVTVLEFSGTRSNVDSPGAPAARCGGQTTISIRNAPPGATSTGTSNLGAFTATMSHCINLPPSLTGPTPYGLGEFVFDFGSGNTLFGTYDGQLLPAGSGLFNLTQIHLVTGGTGQYAGASGTLTNNGQLTLGQGQPRATHTITGRILAPVPEPGTWLMMLLGFGLVGWGMRRHQAPLIPAMA